MSSPFEKFTQLLIEKKPVLITLLRAGLPFQQGFLNYFDDSNCAFISAYRHNIDAHNFDIKMEYVSMPCIDDRVVIISDPMIASGNSMVLALEEILKRGTPKHIHIAGIIVSSTGKKYLEEHITFKNCTLWIGAEDRKLNKNSYIIPGLGDAGDLAYGKKIEYKNIFFDLDRTLWDFETNSLEVLREIYDHFSLYDLGIINCKSFIYQYKK